MADRFRELENPQAGRLKDVVLMATVTGFEALRHPRRNDLKQFAELFEPLFLASSDEARRQAAAALSQCQHVPQSVALQIGTAPISIAAIFLTRSTAVADATLTQIIRSQGPAHATAIARRDNLSVQVVDALVERRQTSSMPSATAAASPVVETLGQEPLRPVTATADSTASKLAREEKLRADIRALARAGRPVTPTAASATGPAIRPVIAPIDDLHAALLVRFSRSGEANLFVSSLTAALSAPQALGERILLDVSGQQLAVTLTALTMPPSDSLFVLTALYPHLGERLGGATRAEALMSSLDTEESLSRVQSWLHVETEEASSASSHQSYLAPDRAADPRQAAAPRQDRQARGAVEIQAVRSFGRKR